MFEELGDSEGLAIFTLIQKLLLLCLSAERFAILDRVKHTILDGETSSHRTHKLG